MEFPACLVKGASFTGGHVIVKNEKVSQSVFSFPKGMLVCRDSPVQWPLYFRTAAPGKLSLYITIYYEVLPSLDVSFQISPRPSRLQEFLVRIDVVNRTSSEHFKVHQLSSVGNDWEISLLQPMDTVFHSDFLMAGQALSCCFKFKDCRKQVKFEDNSSSLVPLERTDIRLVYDNDEHLFNISRSPFIDFHHYERMNQTILDQDDQISVDFILISWSRNDNNPASNLFSYQACHCRLSS